MRHREQEAGPKNIRKGAGSKEISNLGAGSTKNLEMEQGAREIIGEQEEKLEGSREQGAKRDEKGAVKIGKEERVPKNRREWGAQGKKSKGAGSINPP